MAAAVGDVFFLRCTLCNPPKDKFFVVALAEPLKLFLINSEMTEFQRARPDRAMAQAEIAAAEHDFLEYDSIIGCDWLSHEYGQDTLERALANDKRYRCIGRLSDAARRSVAAALRDNVHIPGKWLKLLKQHWP
ncbi:hypothetical protein WH218_19660 [Stenotrophomonas indicatrix]|uniref:hypothetical protein n=1 Tax=Stenotrophomonas indicatrix TaxID=2045451 RepID=UPI0015DDA830|nr:hypothetical protein [Stenotrophomonas indicatrix]MBA0101252.1 hypothetical protein [Stenotrophomonas indicatrix]